MPIEFDCPNCQQILRVPDSASGKQARCPSCNEIARVPEPTPTPPETSPREDEPVNPYAAPTLESAESTPGPTLSGQIANRPLEVGPIMNHCWKVWQAHLGLLVGIVVTMAVINFFLSIPLSFAQAALNANGEEELALLVSLCGQMVSSVVGIYLGIGNAQICLKLARGQNAEFIDLFGGASRFFPVLGVSILLGLALSAGFLLCIVPGIFLALMWWPVYYLSVDAKADVLQTFSVAKTITDNNYGTVIVLWLISLGILILGVLALCIGIIFAAPLVSMMWATAYLMMSGQLATEQQHN